MQSSIAVSRPWSSVRLCRRFWGAVVAALGLVCLVDALVGYKVTRDEAIDSAIEEPFAQYLPPAPLSRVEKAGRALSSLAVKKRSPEEGEWLDRHPEQGQTFAQYRASNPSRATATRSKLYILPIGPMSPAQRRIVEECDTLLGIHFGLPSKTLEAIELVEIPESARRERNGREQILTSYLLDDVLPQHRRDDAVAVLGLTGHDLWPGENWNYVFGQASFRARVGVHSFARYGDPSAGDEAYQLCLSRTLKVALHETGHMFGLAHCRDWECTMNGANHLEEADRNQLGFCPECEQKVWWSCRTPIRGRYENLVAFAKRNHLPDAERLWQSSLDKVRDIVDE